MREPSTAPPEAALAPRLREALATLRIGQDRRTVLVGERPVTGGTARELRAALGAVLYDEWHAGLTPEAREARGGRNGAAAGPASSRRDRAFEDRLTAATPHTLTPVDAVVRPGPEPRGDTLLAELGRVLVRVPTASVRTQGAVGPDRHARLDLPAVRPALSPGFLLLDGPCGGLSGGAGRPVLRMYVHLTDPDAAPGVWRTLLAALAARSARYRAKVLSRPWSYPRRDALVVYLEGADAPSAAGLADEVTGLPGVGRETSVFAHEVAPGVALAWEPADNRPGRPGKSFGQHRAAAVAEGLLRHAHDPDATDGFLRPAAADPAGADAAREVHRCLRAAAVDPAEPARNLDSAPFPAPGRPRRAAGAG
jgi:hypothetical protein